MICFVIFGFEVIFQSPLLVFGRGWNGVQGHRILLVYQSPVEVRRVHSYQDIEF